MHLLVASKGKIFFHDVQYVVIICDGTCEQCTKEWQTKIHVQLKKTISAESNVLNSNKSNLIYNTNTHHLARLASSQLK